MKLSLLLLAVTQPILVNGSSLTWETVNLDNLYDQHIRDPGVYLMGQVDTLEECQTACASNSSCKSFDWAGDVSLRGHCRLIKNCYLRSDNIWVVKPNTHCNHSAGRKMFPPPKPKPPMGYQPNIVFFLQV